MDSFRFFCSCCQEEHIVCSVQKRRCEGQSVWRWLRRSHGYDQALLLVQGSLVREERGRVPFGSQTQLDEVEVRYAVCDEDAPYLIFVCLRGCVVIWHFSGHAVYMAGKNRNLAQQFLLRHVKVAFWIVRWYTALVAPEDLYQSPINL